MPLSAAAAAVTAKKKKKKKKKAQARRAAREEKEDAAASAPPAASEPALAGSLLPLGFPTLFNRQLFCPYSGLPASDDDGDWLVRERVYYPKLQWSFMAQIMLVRVLSTDVAVAAQDIDGSLCTLLVERVAGHDVDERQFVVGSTVFVRYARRVEVLGHRYVHAGAARYVKVVPATLTQLSRLEADRLELLMKKKLSTKCQHCEQEGATLLCARCELTRYCSKACQVAHWATHKLSCHTWEALKDVVLAAGLAYYKVEVPEQRPSEGSPDCITVAGYSFQQNVRLR